MSGRKLLFMHFHVVIEVRQNCLHFDSNVGAKMVTSRTDYFSRTSSAVYPVMQYTVCFVVLQILFQMCDN